jgi:hypothetical protein
MFEKLPSILFEEHPRTVLMRLITETVDNYRKVAIRSQLFASYYIRHCLSEDIDLNPIIFSQPFFYA